MRIVMSSGHSKKVRGATGNPVPPCCEEVTEARRLTEAVATALRNRGGHTVTTLHDDVSTSQSANLNWLTSHHNAQPAHDIDVSFHMNCYDSHAHGCEVLYVNQTLGKERATKIVNAICKVTGLTNRGPKLRTDLAFLNNTTTPGSVLIETAFCDNVQDCATYLSRFDAIAEAIASAIVGEEVQPGPTPPQAPAERPPVSPPVPTGHPQLSEGSQGPTVAGLQETLGIPADGDFGNITATQVEAFQAACGLTPDAVVGPNTWAAVDDLEARLSAGPPRLPPELVDQITQLADDSDIAGYEWPNRGMSPPGFMSGMSLCFAVAFNDLTAGASYAQAMAKPLGSSSVDALKVYETEFKKLGISLATPEDRLMALFTLMIGLSMRESSGRYCEGRDLSADNVESTTAESGLMQTSWNIKTADPSLPGLLIEYFNNPNGFLEEFAENVDPTAENLDCYGSGEGARYQWLAKYSPAFAVMVAGVGLRSRKDHWGPVKRKELTLSKDAWTLLKSVEQLIISVA